MAVLNIVMKILVPQKAGNILSTWATLSFLQIPCRVELVSEFLISDAVLDQVA
jgi:hypothetical protein